MKLLLTSAGITNQAISQALERLLEKSPRGVKLAFVPTASNVEAGEKDWLSKLDQNRVPKELNKVPFSYRL